MFRYFIFLIPFWAISQTIPDNAKKLIKAYPDIILGYKDNTILFKDGSSLFYDDGKTKDNKEVLENPDIEDQFQYRYKLDEIGKTDAGRIRNEAFFKKIYGSSKNEVESHLTEIVWCPKLVNQKIKVTSVQHLDKIITALSNELDQHPEFKKYLTNIGGTFNWRNISGSSRLSMHSFGMTIDINTQYANYWQWDCHCKNEAKIVSYQNKIPQKLVAIFEKYGFIWGGRWQHYDTMHFEYRPELLF